MDNRAGRERPELDRSHTLVGPAKLHRAEVDTLLIVEGMPKAQNVVDRSRWPASTSEAAEDHERGLQVVSPSPGLATVWQHTWPQVEDETGLDWTQLALRAATTVRRGMSPFVAGCEKHPSQGGDTGSNPVGTTQVRGHVRGLRGQVAPHWPRGVHRAVTMSPRFSAGSSG
jgi:hypothetical protein